MSHQDEHERCHRRERHGATEHEHEHEERGHGRCEHGGPPRHEHGGPGQRGGGGRGRAPRRRGAGTVQRFLDTCLLVQLRKGPAHGYELLNALPEYGVQAPPPGPIYRTLRQLEHWGFVDSEWDTESRRGPARRVYQINPAGEEFLGRCVEELRESHEKLGRLLEAYAAEPADSA